MRIRKGGKFSAEIASQCMENQPSQAYVCEVNRSPWDVIPFSQDNINFSLNFQCQRKFRSDETESLITTEGPMRSPVEAEEDVICLGSTNNKRILFGGSNDGTIWDYSRLGSGRHPKETRIFEGEDEADQIPYAPRVVEAESAKVEGEGTSSRRARATKRAIKDDDYYYYSGYELESN